MLNMGWAACLVAMGSAACALPAVTLDAAVGREVPRVSVLGLDGSALELPAARDDGVTVVAFFTTWCPASAALLREVQALGDALGAPRGLRLLAVDVGDSPQDVRAFVRRHGVRSPVGLDFDEELAHAVGLSTVPAALVLKGGRVRFALVGYREDEDVERMRAEVFQLASNQSRTPALRRDR